jgi:hypothetical protein
LNGQRRCRSCASDSIGQPVAQLRDVGIIRWSRNSNLKTTLGLGPLLGWTELLATALASFSDSDAVSHQRHRATQIARITSGEFRMR